jgi:hypothetical protein
MHFERVKDPKVHKFLWNGDLTKTQPKKNYVTDYKIQKSLPGKAKMPEGAFIIKNVYDANELKRVEKKVHTWFMNKDETDKVKYETFHGDIIKYYKNSWKELIDKLQKKDESLLDMIVSHMDRLLDMMDVNKNERKTLLNNSGITLIKYKTGTGLRQHLDNPKNKGPTFTLSLNSKYSPLDFMPFKELGNNPCVRVYVPRGQILVIDGNSRFAYRHGMPTNYKYTNEYRYSITVRFHPLSRHIDTKSTCSKKVKNMCWSYLPRLKYK